MTKTTLVCVAGGETYWRYANSLMRSARVFFNPTDKVSLRILDGEEGWPRGTMMRYHRLLEDFPKSDYVFMCDADMLVVSPVGQEILPENGITATLHPGYIGADYQELPFERDSKSAACVDYGTAYYCGGFVGGTAEAFMHLAEEVAEIVDTDMSHDRTPRWHDESALNRVLYETEPEVVLSPSYCYPDNDAWYRTFWTEDYKRKIVAIDKTEKERLGR